jgi:hypothetical protein
VKGGLLAGITETGYAESKEPRKIFESWLKNLKNIPDGRR